MKITMPRENHFFVDKPLSDIDAALARCMPTAFKNYVWKRKKLTRGSVLYRVKEKSLGVVAGIEVRTRGQLETEIESYHLERLPQDTDEGWEKRNNTRLFIVSLIWNQFVAYFKEREAVVVRGIEQEETTNADASGPAPASEQPTATKVATYEQKQNTAQSKSKKGPRRYSRSEKIAAREEWENLDRDANPITLEKWLENKFGYSSEGILNVPASTFYGWPKS